MQRLILLSAALAISVAAWSQSKPPGESEPNLAPRGGTIPIPDDGYDGTLASMACQTVTVGTAGTVEDVDVTAALEHTWVGDLTMKLVSPAGTVATVLSRPGFADAVDDGTGCCGDSSNLVLTSPITFSTTNGMFDAELMGGTIGGDALVCQDDGECDFIPNPGSAIDSGDLSALFDGETAAGDWDFCVGDGAGGDTGNLGAVTLDVTAAAGPPPPPAAPVEVPTLNLYGLLVALGLIGIAGLVTATRRNRQS